MFKTCVTITETCRRMYLLYIPIKLLKNVETFQISKNVKPLSDLAILGPIENVLVACVKVTLSYQLTAFLLKC